MDVKQVSAFLALPQAFVYLGLLARSTGTDQWSR